MNPGNPNGRTHPPSSISPAIPFKLTLLETTLDQSPRMRVRPSSPIQQSRELLSKKYYETFQFYFSKPITEIIADSELPHVLLYKDYLYYDDEREFLRGFYKVSEFQEKHKLLCSLIDNLDFTVRPNLAVHKQNNIILKRNLKLQKLYFMKASAEADGQQLATHQIPVIPRYIEDIVYSTQMESDTQQTGNYTVSLDNVGLNERNMLNSLKQQAEDTESRKSYETAGFANPCESRCSMQSKGIAANIDVSFRKSDFEFKEPIEPERVSLGSSFNMGDEIQMIQGNSISPRSNTQTLEDSVCGFFQEMPEDVKETKPAEQIIEKPVRQNENKPSIPESEHKISNFAMRQPDFVLKPSEVVKPNPTTVKRRNPKTPEQKNDAGIVQQNVPKTDEVAKEQGTVLTQAVVMKPKEESQKKVANLRLGSPNAAMKRELRIEAQESSSLADKILNEKPVSSRGKNLPVSPTQHFKERGPNLRVSTSPKVQKTALSKSPVRENLLDESKIAEKRSLMLPRPRLATKIREAKSPVHFSKHNPITTKINLTNSSQSTADENSLASGIKIGASDAQHSAGISNGTLNKNIGKFKSDDLYKAALKGNAKHEKSPERTLFTSPEKGENSQPESTTLSPQPETKNPPKLTYVPRAEAVLSPRYGLKTPVNHKRKGSHIPSEMNTPTGKHTPSTHSSESSVDKVSEKGSLILSYKIVSGKHTTDSKKTTDAKLSFDESTLKRDVPSTTEASTMNKAFSHSVVKKTLQIDIQIVTETEQSTEAQVPSTKHKARSPEPVQRDPAPKKTVEKESPKLVYIPVKVPSKAETLANNHSPFKRTIELNIEKSTHKLESEKASHISHISSNTGRNENAGLSEERSHSRRHERYEYSIRNQMLIT